MLRYLTALLIAAISLSLASATPETAKGGWAKVLFLGNSITLHGPSARIGWLGNWGMAASAKEKDFVHIILRSVEKTTGAAPKAMIRNVATFERQYATYDVEGKLKDAFEFGADLVVMAIGENVPRLTTEEAKTQFRAAMLKLLRGLKRKGNPKIVVRSCFWPNGAKDEVLKQVCQEVGGTFVDIGHLGKDKRNRGESERKFQHKGVAAHPGDRGMQAIAEAILSAVTKHGEGEDKK